MARPPFPHSAHTFEEAYANTDYRLPLRDEQLDYFYVARASGTSRLEVLKQALSLGTAKGLDTKFLVTGHLGCGKSTEINRLVKDIATQEDLRENLFVVSYSASDLLDLQDVDYTDIAFSIVAGVYDRLHELDITFSSDTIEKITEWISMEVETFTSTTLGAEIELAGGQVGIGRLLNMMNLIGINIRGGGTRGKEVRRLVKKRAPELRDLVNNLLEELRELTGMSVLLVIDDLDKLRKDDAVRVFREDGPFLTLLNCMAIYTAPVSMMYQLGESPSFEKYQRYAVPMFKVASHNGSAESGDLDRLVEMVYRRVSPELFVPGIIEQMAVTCGGVVRHLIKMVQDSCLYCQTFQHPVIDAEAYSWVLERLKQDYSRWLGRADYEILKRIHQTKSCHDAEEAWEYLQSLCVLEYSNGGYWYDLHPVVQMLLGERTPNAEESA
ncbi:MAG: hypothetical protein GXP41_03345 [Chloroflexi bacterium]|nr:hypothetical protein [Chloroflexota bacterium]